MEEVDGMHVVAVRASPHCCAHVKAEGEKESVKDVWHYFYIKEHKLKHPSKEHPEGRTLFVLNIPHNAQDALTHVFSSFGKVASVTLNTITLGSKKKGTAEETTVAHVVFTKPSSLKKALTSKTKTDITLPKPTISGKRLFEAQYEASTVTDYDALQDEIDKSIESFDEERDGKKAKLLASAAMDGEGWTLVSRGTVDTLPESEKAHRHTEKQRLRKKKKKTELVNFYRFQKLEAQKQELALKRKKFDEDKHRMLVLKNSRKFRPY